MLRVGGGKEAGGEVNSINAFYSEGGNKCRLLQCVCGTYISLFIFHHNISSLSIFLPWIFNIGKYIFLVAPAQYILIYVY